jgi:hypothetical protein
MEIAAACDAVGGLEQTELVDERGEPLAVLRQIDRVGRGAEDRDACVLERLREVERGLPAELDDHAHEGAVPLLDVEDLEHVLRGQRLEVQAVGGVIVGRHRFRVAVDHDRLIARIRERETRMAATIIELDPLPDPVRAATEDDDLAPVSRLALALGLAEARRFVSRIHVRRLGVEFRRASVDPLEHRTHAQTMPQRADFGFGNAAGHRHDRIVDQPRPTRDTARVAAQIR